MAIKRELLRIDTLSPERVDRLRAKEKVYLERWDKVWQANSQRDRQAVQGQNPEWYAHFILHTLLENRVELTTNLEKDMKKILGDFYEPDYFDSRLEIIKSYIDSGQAGGKELPYPRD